jgi:hypothetical protein
VLTTTFTGSFVSARTSAGSCLAASVLAKVSVRLPASPIRWDVSIGFGQAAPRERLDPFERAIFSLPNRVRCHLAFDINPTPFAARLELAKHPLPTDRQPLVGLDEVLHEIRIRISQGVIGSL